MPAAPMPANEEQRLAALRQFQILDTPFEKDYDQLCQLAATLCGAPIALISFVDRDRQWVKASVGLEIREIDRDLSFCAHALWDEEVFVVEDASRDVRFADNPLVTGDPDIRFYAGQPLWTAEGLALGTLCTIDRVPRKLSPAQREALQILARQVVTHLELRRAARELRRLNDDKDRFFSVIAHDLRSPFSGLLGLVDLMKDQGTSMDRQEVDRYIGLLHGGLHNLYGFAENLLRWVQLEQGKMTFRPEPLTARDLVEPVLAALGEAAARKNCPLRVDVPESLKLRCDRNMVEACLRNLLSNAVKFNPAGRPITVTARQVGEEVRFTFTDVGDGMNPAQLAALSLGTTVPSRPGTNGEPGSGLGLTLARMFAARHGGRLEFASQVGAGTSVTLVLPLQPPADPATQPVAQQS